MKRQHGLHYFTNYDILVLCLFLAEALSRVLVCGLYYDIPWSYSLVCCCCCCCCCCFIVTNDLSEVFRHWQTCSFFLLILARSNYDHYARECNFGILMKKQKQNKKNSSAVWELTTEGERLFHCGIVLGKKEFFRASLYVWYLQYWALCDDLVGFKLRAGVRYLSFSIDTTPECILWKRSREDWSLRASAICYSGTLIIPLIQRISW